MAYLDYEYTETDTFASIAEEFGITTTELYKVNNILYPYPDKPSELIWLSGNLKVPNVLTGNESYENRVRETTIEAKENKPLQKSVTNKGKVGYYSQKKCWIRINGIIYFFPCWPENYSDTRQSNFTSQHPLGRSEPFQIYQNSGPRTVSVTFRMHREMEHTNTVEDVVAAVQSAVYPTGSDSIVPKVTLNLGNSCYITGVIAGTVSTDWGETINADDKYNVVTLSFTVTECTGNPKLAGEILQERGRGT